MTKDDRPELDEATRSSPGRALNDPLPLVNGRVAYLATEPYFQKVHLVVADHQNLQPSGIPAYLYSLTRTQLRGGFSNPNTVASLFASLRSRGKLDDSPSINQERNGVVAVMLCYLNHLWSTGDERFPRPNEGEVEELCSAAHKNAEELEKMLSRCPLNFRQLVELIGPIDQTVREWMQAEPGRVQLSDGIAIQRMVDEVVAANPRSPIPELGEDGNSERDRWYADITRQRIVSEQPILHAEAVRQVMADVGLKENTISKARPQDRPKYEQHIEKVRNQIEY